VFRENHRTEKTLSASLNAVSLAAYTYVFQHALSFEWGKAVVRIHTATSQRAVILTPRCRQRQHNYLNHAFNAFTALTTKTMQTFEDCGRHIAGIMAVIKPLDRRQLETRLGLQLFVHMCSITIQNGIYHSLRVLADLIKLRQEAEAYLDADDPTWKLFKIIVELAGF
jgi:hypothetical protein